MIEILKVASYISQRYEYEYGCRIDEKKLHILLYFMQRECLVQTGKSLFEDTFCAQYFGPYLARIHTAYVKNKLCLRLSDEELFELQGIIARVYVPLAVKKVRSLISLVHGEYSWKKAYEEGVGTAIKTEDIEHDANSFKMRCFLLSNLDQFRKPSYA